MRLFFAYESEPALRKAAADYIAVLSHTHVFRSGISWTAPSAMHCTLKFIGERNEFETLVEAMKEPPYVWNCSGLAVNTLTVTVFPNTVTPRVIVLLLNESSGALARRASECDTRLSLFGIRSENRPYVPHITLGRIRNDWRPPVRSSINPEPFVFPPFPETKFFFGSLELFSSTLSPNGPIYKVMEVLQ